MTPAVEQQLLKRIDTYRRWGNEILHMTRQEIIDRIASEELISHDEAEKFYNTHLAG